MSSAPYGFDPARFRAAKTNAGVSLAGIARAAGVSSRAVNLYLAGARVPRPAMLLRLAAAVGVTAADLCVVEAERLVHLRVFSGRSRAEMAEVLGMTEETYRLLETTGHRGPLSTRHYSLALYRRLEWEEWAPQHFGVTPERLLAACQRTVEHQMAEREGSASGGAAADRRLRLAVGRSLSAS